ncbi:MAG: Inner rane component of cytoplasmic domain [Verrucomicrobiota bacterium]
MIRFRILSGKQAGSVVDARRFPFRVGRDVGQDLVVEEQGAWNRHCEISFDKVEGFILSRLGDALVVLNGHTCMEPVRLHNGDIIEIGACRLQFWLGEVKQRGYRFREILVWLGIAAVTLSQVFLIYRLIR